jgi:hypothetical protein
MAPLARVVAGASHPVFQFVAARLSLVERVRVLRFALARRLPERRRLFELALITIVILGAVVWVWVLWTQPMNRR